MRSRGAQILGWGNGSYCLYRISPRGSYSTHSSVNPEPPEKGGSEMVKERALAALKHAGILGREWGQWSSQMTRATLNYWWERYEEFVGLNEVREAQAKVTEAETAFMVSRGLVQEAQSGLEAVQLRLKEVRTRLDRVSREEAHYLELATLEHKLLQEERRLRTAHESSEGSEREKFALFSAAVRGSHEKERTRAERTKNWSIIGSVLGTIIGVMGSTYVNRVRLQELKSLLLEAQKGPESLQEALRVQAGDHRFQQEALQALIDTLRVTLMQEGRGTAALSHAPTPAAPPSPTDALGELTSISRDTQGLVDALQPRLGHLEEGLGRLEEGLGRLEGGVAQLEDGMCAFRGLVEEKSLRPPDGQPLMESLSPWRQEKTPRDLEEAQAWMEGGVARVEGGVARLEVQIQKSGVMNSVITIAAAALTVPALYILLRGT